MSTDAIIDNLLLVSQIAQISSNYGAKWLVFPHRLCGSGETGTENDERSEETGAEYSRVRHDSDL